MQYDYVAYDSKHYSTALRLDPSTGNLTWDNVNGQDVMIVQTPFGIDASEIMAEQICPAISKTPLKKNQYIEVLEDIWVRKVSAAEKVQNSGCPLNERACTYTVFSVMGEGNDRFLVFEPAKDQAYTSSSFDVPFEIVVDVYRYKYQKGFGPLKRMVDSDYWVVTFSGDTKGMAGNVGLYYTVEQSDKAIKIPLTAQAVHEGCAYVKSEQKPLVRSGARGVKVCETE